MATKNGHLGSDRGYGGSRYAYWVLAACAVVPPTRAGVGAAFRVFCRALRTRTIEAQIVTNTVLGVPYDIIINPKRPIFKLLRPLFVGVRRLQGLGLRARGLWEGVGFGI